MRLKYSMQKEKEEEDMKIRAEETKARKMLEVERCENPKTAADFDMLYNKLEQWRLEEEEKLEGSKSGRELNVARAKLVHQEAGILSKISQNKNLAKVESKENSIRQFLDKVIELVLGMSNLRI